jgi:hypothetical protein
LPEGARVFIDAAQKQGRTRFDRLEGALFGATAAEALGARMTAFVDAQRLDWPACVDRMEEVARRFHWNPIVRQPSGFVPLLKRHRDGLLKLDALACASSVLLERARTGALPRDVSSSCPAIEPEAKCGEQEAPMHIVDDGTTPRLAVQLSDGSEFAVPLGRTPQASAAALRCR